MAAKTHPFRMIRKMPFEVKTGMILDKKYKVTSIKSVTAIKGREVEIIGMCKEVEKK